MLRDLPRTVIAADGRAAPPRRRSALAALVLVTVAFAVSPGRILPDTKLDIALNPGGFLSRALHMWDPTAAFGQVQNQAYGYFFPMGPFYLLVRGVGISPWIAQRLWLSLVLCAACFGLVKLAAALGIGTPEGRLFAGFCYALAPRAQELLAANSAEFLPTALLPWMLLPLVHGSRRGSPRRAAALSALAVVCMGGINATAELAVLVVPLLYLLTRERGPRRRRLLGWWLGCTAAVSLWWLGPTYLMGKYIFGFLGYTENATTTTSVTSLANTLRGTSDWVGFLPTLAAPWWPAGHSLSTEATYIVATALLAALGLLGLSRRGLPERAFLVGALLLGAALVTAGHAGTVAGPLGPQIRDLLDGPLAPLRNVHKFDALIRLPLTLGLAALVRSPYLRKAYGGRRRPRLAYGSKGAPEPRPYWRPTLAGLVVGVAAVTALPALTPGIGPQGTATAIPAYWRSAADWLNSRTGSGTVMAVPGEQFGQFTWGREMDDPLQSLLTVRWATRDATPYGSAGVARLVRAIDERLANGQGSAGLAEVLGRMGVRYLLVRNDLDRGAVGSARPGRVHQAIAGTPGLLRVAVFGPNVRSWVSYDAVTGFDQPYKALEVYRVPSTVPAASAVSGAPLRVTGGPEALLTLADQGLLGSRPVVFDDDGSSGTSGETVVTDSLRRREVDFSDVRNGASATMTADQPYTDASKTKDVLDPGWDKYQAVVRYSGISDVTASSSASDATAVPGDGSRAAQPYAALDGDKGTSWMSSGWRGAVGEWLKVSLDRPLDPGTISVRFVLSDLLGPAVSEVAVETAAGTLRQPVKAVRTPQTLRVPRGATTWIRLRVTRTARTPKATAGTRAGIAELTIPGVKALRYLRVPAVPGATSYAFTNRADAAPACMPGSKTWVCSPLLGLDSEDGAFFGRMFTAGRTADLNLTGTAVLTGRKAITALTGPSPATASSTFVDEAADDARSAFDGDLTTAWIAGQKDQNPVLTLGFGHEVDLSSLRLRFPYEAGAPSPGVTVRLTGDAGDYRQAVTAKKGLLSFAAMRTSKLTLTFPHAPGIQISEVQIAGVTPPATGTPVTAACGTGPAFTLAGRTVRTRLIGATAADLQAGRAVRYASCAATPVTAGSQALSSPAAGPYRISEAVLTPATRAPAGTATTSPATSPATSPGTATAATPATAQVRTWGKQARQVTVNAPGGGYLVTAENLNAGWSATLDGRPLRAVRLDGWRQAWLLPAGAHGTVHLDYAPDRTYRLMLGAGLALVLVILALAVARPRGPDPDPDPAAPRRWPPWLVWPVAAAAGLWLGGAVGLAALPLGALAAALGPPYARRLLIAAPLAAAGGLLALDALVQGSGRDPLPALWTATLPQLLCLITLGALAGVRRRQEGGRERRRTWRSSE